MTAWSLSQLLAGLHERIEQELALARKSFGHSGTKGDASQDVWLQLLSHYLPERYRAASAHIVDSKGAFSDQIDVVAYDRQYSPIIFKMGEQIILPAECLCGVRGKAGDQSRTVAVRNGKGSECPETPPD
jgi:hypothetical protein